MEKILIIDDEKDVHYSFKRILQNDPYELLTACNGEDGLKEVERHKPDLVLMDIRLGGLNGLEVLEKIRRTDARIPVIMMTAYGTTHTAIEAMKLGAFDYILKPLDVPRIKSMIQSALKSARDMKSVIAIAPQTSTTEFQEGIVGRSEIMQNIYKTIGQVSHSDATVMITGESGTGKEMVAKAIYHHSLRSQKPFLAINCSAIPENLLESELFGHEKGSFTGAQSQRIGKFEQCHGGTLFLDEIGDMAMPTQTKILRVLQENEITRIGSNNPVKINVRIIAATNKNLEQSVRDRQFREDLFYRLNVVRIHLPPLRDRKDDIPLLVEYFLHKLRKQHSTIKTSKVSSEALELLQRHSWPGNIRELENCIHRTAVMSKSDTIITSDLSPEITGESESSPSSQTGTTPPSATSNHSSTSPTLEDALRTLVQHAESTPGYKLLPQVEHQLIVLTLAHFKGNQVKAAALLGITRATLRSRIEKLDIKQAE